MAPKLRAMEIIEELEPHRRGVYCGSIGYLSRNGDMMLNIAIRTAVYQIGSLCFTVVAESSQTRMLIWNIKRQWTRCRQ